MLNVKQGVIKFHFGMIQIGTEPWSPRLLANTLNIMPKKKKILFFHIYLPSDSFPFFFNVYTHTHTCMYIYWPIYIMVTVFTNGSGDWGSIPGQVIPKTQKMLQVILNKSWKQPPRENTEGIDFIWI